MVALITPVPQENPFIDVLHKSTPVPGVAVVHTYILILVPVAKVASIKVELPEQTVFCVTAAVGAAGAVFELMFKMLFETTEQVPVVRV